MAQSSLGAIVGIVTDPTGAVTPGAKVVVTNLETNVSFEYETDHVGSYYLPSLIPGRYRVNANKAGFRPVTVTPVVVDVNQTVRVDISMPLGGVGEAVEVSAIAQLVNTDTSTLGQVVGDRQMIDLPLSGRDFTNLIALDVGVTRLQGGIAASFRLHGLDSNFASVSVNGTRPSSISYLIDGVTTNDPLFQVVTMVPPPDAIQEFKLQNALYSADFGMGAAQVNIALKSGTNTLHGSAWEFLRNDALQPMNPRFHTSTPLKQNQFGAAGGGPVYLPRIYNGRNRTFFFGSYEGGRRRTGSVSQGQVATQQEKQGNFSDWPVQLYDPMTGVPNPGGNPAVIRDPFPNNQIPVARFASVSKNLLAYSPDSNVTCAALPCGNYQAEIVKPINTATFTVRGDQYFSNSDRIFGQFLYQNQYSDSPSLIPLGGSLTTQNSRQVGLKWTHIFSPRTINEARAGFNRINFGLNFDTAYGPTNYWQSVGLQNLAPGGAYNALPYVNIGSQYTPIGSNNSCPFLNILNIFQYSDTFTATRGRHSLKLGADIRRNQNFNENGFQGNGNWTLPEPTPLRIRSSRRRQASRTQEMRLPTSCWATSLRRPTRQRTPGLAGFAIRIICSSSRMISASARG
jgi:hypothetical protein